MRYLKLVLASVYIILMLLLLFNMCGEKNANSVIEPIEIDTIPVPVTIEDTSAVERARTIGQNGNLKVTLLWDFAADIDLHILEPTGEHIYHGNKRSSKSDGFLDCDNRVGGTGAAENIFWKRPPQGEYRISVKYYGKVGPTPIFGTCRVVVFKENKEPFVYEVSFNDVGEKKEVVTVNIE